MVITIASNHFENLSIAQLESLSLEPTGKKIYGDLKHMEKKMKMKYLGRILRMKQQMGRIASVGWGSILQGGMKRWRRRRKVVEQLELKSLQNPWFLYGVWSLILMYCIYIWNILLMAWKMGYCVWRLYNLWISVD